MNQRIRKSRDRRRDGQDVGRSAFATGGHVSSQARGADADVRVPQRTTGDVSGEGLTGSAKASPFFKRLDEKLSETPQDKEEERRVIAQATETTESETETQTDEEETDQDDE